MNIERILSELGISTYTSYKEVLDGADSSVWKIELPDDTAFALRILPATGIGQFLEEEMKIALAVEAGIQVPNVLCVKVVGNSAVMLMEWANGVPVLEQLMTHPESARIIGIKFGEAQATIHKIRVPEQFINRNSWLTPKSVEEKELFESLSDKFEFKSNALIHLDFHPLNVLTDGEEITAVIDWANAAAGDPRFDTARTFSILRLEATRPGSGLDQFTEVFKAFEVGWKEGYGKVNRGFELPSLFNAWAGTRMIRDLSGKREESEFVRIKDWANTWMNQE